MLAYHNTPIIKKIILKQLQIQQETSDIIKDRYCKHKNYHQQDNNYFGIPATIANLSDAIFAGLTSDSLSWHTRVMSAIPVGSELFDASHILKDFAAYLLVDPTDGIIQYTKPGSQIHEIILKTVTVEKCRNQYGLQRLFSVAQSAFDVTVCSEIEHIVLNVAHSLIAAYYDINYAVCDAVYFFSKAAYAAAKAAALAAHAYTSVRDALAASFSAAYDASAVCDVEYIKMSNKLIDLLEKQEAKNDYK